MTIKSKLLLFTIIIVPLIDLSLCGDFEYKLFIKKSPLRMIEFEKIDYVGQHSAARLGRGFQTRPKKHTNRLYDSIHTLQT